MSRHKLQASGSGIAVGRLSLAALGCCLALALAASPARAASVHVFSSSFGSQGSGVGQVSSPQGVAVNAATGDIYVADTGNHRIDEFDSTGTFVRAWGWGVADGAASFETCTTSCQDGISGSGAGQFTTPEFVAVDNSSGLSAGDIYVGDTGTDLVQKFDSSGSLITDWGTGGQLNGSTATAPIAGPFGPLAGVTVDGSGSLWVYDQNSNMFEFAQDATFTEDWNSGRGVISDGIDADSAGNLYVLTGAGTVEQFSPTGTDVGPVNGDVFNPTGFAVDRSDNDVYMDSGGTLIYHYLSSCDAGGSCTAADTFGSGHLSGSATALAVDSANGTVYAADAGGNDIAIFTGVPLPTATTGQASNVTSTTAILNGTVNPNGVAVSSCEFEYVDDADYNASASDPYSTGDTAPCSQSPGSGTSAVAVSAGVTGLQPGTIYHFRLAAGNLGGPSAGADQTFDTPGVGFGFQSFTGSVVNQDGSPDTQAGSHPYELTTTFTMNPTVVNGSVTPDQDLKDLHVNLPAGLIGDPQAVPQCDHTDFDGVFAGGEGAACPTDSEVGILNVQLGFSQSLVESVPIFNLVPPPGTPAELGGNVAGVRVFLDASVRTGSDYGITIAVDNTEQRQIAAAQLTIWGVPADPSHDNQRCDAPSTAGNLTGQATCGASTPFGGAPQAFLTLPTSCGGSLPATVSADSWQNPDSYVSDSLDLLQGISGAPPDLAGCYKLDFSPSITVQPDTSVADSPSGLSVDVHVPQPDNTNYIYNSQVVAVGINYDTALGEANLDDATVTLPAGVSVNPSAANGLAACTPAEIGIDNASEPSCPDASKIGSVEVDTPLLPDPLTGGVYFAQQTQNPFGSLLAIYVTAEADGVLIKLAGQVVPDPVTGQLTTTFSNNPQLPFTDFKLDFFGGPTGVLATPDQCGTYMTTSSLTPWSGNTASSPSDSFTISSGCLSGFAPSFTAGTQNAQAGSYSPFTLSFERSDTDQYLSGLSVTLPPGMLAKLAGVQECTDAQLASISSAPGTGAAQAADPSCPAGSQVGTVETGAGPGSEPFFLPGRVYLTGPYKGAPYGLAVVVPALAGPLDLGTVVVRQALYVDPTTAQVTAASDPFPTILDGIPLRIRRIDVNLNRPDFTVNPTSCDPMSVNGTLSSTGGLSAPVSSPFQVGGCQELGFSPKLKMSLNGKGKTRSGDHPTLVSTLTQPFGQANIHTVKVTLPLSMALDPNNSQHVCNYDVAQAVHGGAVGCPASTIVGTATAITPLLSRPLTGKVYLVQGIRFNKQRQRIRTLPSLLIPLRGQIALDLRANTSVNAGSALVTTFSTIPDAAVSKFTLTITGGKKGLLVITGRGRTICNKPQVTGAAFGAQSGKTKNSSITMTTPCRKTKKAKRSKKHKKDGKK